MSLISVLLIITLMKGGVTGNIPVYIKPENPVLKIGQDFTFKCTVAVKILYCRIQLPRKPFGYYLNENLPKNANYSYAGLGMSSGQCGITIARIKDEHNGQFQCIMGTVEDDEEIVGSTNVTVARPPQGPPELMVSPNADKDGAYRENTIIIAICSVQNVRPKATLSWYIGDDQITDGVSREEVIETPGNLFTVNQNFTRRLTWRDNAKALRCEANHIANDNGQLLTTKQISVIFPPRPKDKTIEKFGLVVGEDETIAVQIEANPRPTITWNVGSESIIEGRQDSSQRFTVSQTRNLGNDTWETTLTISAVSPEDVDIRYSLKARNSLGEKRYRVVISTEAAPEAPSCPPIPEECLTCLCEAATDCDFNKVCKGEHCGPFSISYAFWEDGGRHISNQSILRGEESWQTCARDPLCAAQTVRDYTKRYCVDCNGDGNIDCTDFALLHQVGASCFLQPSAQFPEFKERLDNCLKEIAE